MFQTEWMKLPHVNLTMLRVLDALSDERSPTRVGERLGMTQSGVSHAMRAWADVMGGPLAVRRGREVIFTPLGEAVLEEVRAVLGHLQAIARLKSDRTISGHVRLGVVASAAIGIVPPALEALRLQHPAVTVELIEGADQEVADWFAQGILDVAIAMSSLGPDAARLVPIDLVAVIPAGHSLSDRRTVRAVDMASYPFVMSASGCEEAITEYAKARGVEFDISLRIRDTRALLAAVRAGVGVSMLPALSVEGEDDRIVTRALAPPLRRDLHIALAKGASVAVLAIREAIESKSAYRGKLPFIQGAT